MNAEFEDAVLVQWQHSDRSVAGGQWYPDILDAERTVFFMSKLAESQHLRVIGVDPMIADALQETANEMFDDDKIDSSARSYFFTGAMAHGDGWPFHQHHMHFSWDWEDGYEGRSVDAPEGCIIDEVRDPYAPVAQPL